MSKHIRVLCSIVGLMLLGAICGNLRAQSAPAAAPAANFQALVHLFDYDRTTALDIQQKLIKEEEGIRIYDLTYASPKGGRVPAFLVVPASKGPFVPILFGHWGGGDRTEFLAEAELYAQRGAVALIPDYPWDRPAPWRRAVVESFDKPQQDRDVYIQAAIDMRRGIDLLLSRPDVDPKRLAFVGHSYGAQWGAILTAVDRRPKAVVLICGVPDLAAVLRGPSPQLAGTLSKLPKDVLDKYLELNAPLDAINYVSHTAPTPLLFQFASFETNFTRQSMERYYGAASKPKEVLWYDCGHEMNAPQAFADRARWLAKHVGLQPAPTEP
jgi:dienelactone hydrolase